MSPSGGAWAVGVPLLPWTPRRRWRRRGDRSNVDVDPGLVDLPSRDNRVEADAFDGPDAEVPSGGGFLDGFSGLDFLDELALVVIAIGLVVAVFVAAGWVLPLLVLAFEFVVLVLAFSGLALLRTVLRTPWPVRATGPDGATWDWQTVGYRRARRAAAEVAERILRGQPLPAPGRFDPDAPA